VENLHNRCRYSYIGCFVEVSTISTTLTIANTTARASSRRSINSSIRVMRSYSMRSCPPAEGVRLRLTAASRWHLPGLHVFTNQQKCSRLNIAALRHWRTIYNKELIAATCACFATWGWELVTFHAGKVVLLTLAAGVGATEQQLRYIRIRTKKVVLQAWRSLLIYDWSLRSRCYVMWSIKWLLLAATVIC